MASNFFVHTREAVRVTVKKSEPNLPPEWRKFSVDPQITTLEVLYSLLAKAFDIKFDFSIKYKTFDPAGNEIYLPVFSDWDLDAAFLKIHNVSVQTATEPCLMLKIDINPFTEVRECDSESSCSVSTAMLASNTGGTPTEFATRDLMSPLQQSFCVSQKYVQQMQNKLPGLIMNQMEKTFSMVQKAFNMNEETMVVLPPRPPLADDEFRLFLDAMGQIQRFEELRKVIFFGGVEPSLRRVVWKHILNVYPNAMSGNQRMDYMRHKSAQYYKLRETWKRAIKQGCVVGELAYVTSMVKKDVLRTDRLHHFYAGSDDNENIAALFNILTTYALNHPSVSYCQGMSDIASPLLVTMNDEAQAYICFCAIMNRVRGNFMLDGFAMTQKFAHLTEALSFYDAEFWDYLKAQQADDLLFCYRWLLLELKREFPFEDALRMLEVQWSSIKYEKGGEREELKLFEIEFVPIPETSLATGTAGVTPNAYTNGIPTSSKMLCGTPINPSYLLVNQRENAYTTVCALRRQSSSASLNYFTNYASIGEYSDAEKSRNHSSSSKAHQSLNETKTLQFVEGRVNNARSCVGNDHVHLNDDVFNNSNNFTFHDMNPFKNNDDDMPVNIWQEKQIPQAFFTSSSSSFYSDDAMPSTATGCVLEGSLDSNSDYIHISKGFSKLQNENMHSNYNAGSNMYTKKLATYAREGVKRVSSTGGGHFRDLKEKIAASSRKGLNLEECNEKSQQKLVKNFNEFLNFASVNKSRIANDEKISAVMLSTNDMKAKLIKPKIHSPTYNEISTKPTLHPLMKLTKELFDLSLSSDSSSISDTANNTLNCYATAATKIQQPNNLSSYSLHLEFPSQFSSLSHTPLRTTVTECQRDIRSPIASNEYQEEDPSTTPEESQDHDYYPITTAITRELRLESEDLNRHLFEDLILTTTTDEKFDSMRSQIGYEKLGKDSLHLVEDLKENEIMTCPEISELLQAQPQLDKSSIAKTDEKNPINLLNRQTDNNLNLKRDNNINNKHVKNPDIISKLNPLLDESLLLKDEILPEIRENPSYINSCKNSYNISNNPTRLPKALLPISSTSTRGPTAIDEMATTAAEDEVTFSNKAVQFSSNGTSNSKCTPRLPPPSEFGGGNPFLMFLCLSLLLQHRNTIMSCNMDCNEIAMHFDKMVRKHNVTRVLNQARRMYIDYLKNQTSYGAQQSLKSVSSISGQTGDVNSNAAASSKLRGHPKSNQNHPQP